MTSRAMKILSNIVEEYYGERCPDHMLGCTCCHMWYLYDFHPDKCLDMIIRDAALCEQDIHDTCVALRESMFPQTE
jgi:hypothetical protein